MPDIITAENFDTAAIAWIRAAVPGDDRAWRVLTVRERPTEMAMWKAYFHRLGLKPREQSIARAMDTNDSYTLPSFMPGEFDPANAPSIAEMDLAERTIRRIVPCSAEKAAELAALFRTQHPPTSRRPPETPGQIMARLEREKGNPVVIGEGLSKKLNDMRNDSLDNS